MSNTSINRESFLEILYENYRLKNELDHLKNEKSLNEFKTNMLEQIKILSDKVNKLEYRINNETEVSESHLSFEEIKRLISNELVKTKNKITISKIIYNHQYCDSYEDFFKDNIQPLKIKCDGIQISLDNLNDCI